MNKATATFVEPLLLVDELSWYRSLVQVEQQKDKALGHNALYQKLAQAFFGGERTHFCPLFAIDVRRFRKYTFRFVFNVLYRLRCCYRHVRGRFRKVFLFSLVLGICRPWAAKR